MEPLKLLLVDALQSIPPGALTDAIRPTPESVIVELKAAIADHLGSKHYDVIAIGNHDDLGPQLVASIPLILRNTVVVLSNKPLPDVVERRYREKMGIRHFARRGGSFQKLLDQRRYADVEDAVAKLETVVSSLYGVQAQ